MAITSGFFNSITGDRKYYAQDFNSYFEGLVSGGILQNVDNGLIVKEKLGMTIQVDTGKLIDTKGRWMKNDAIINLTLEASDVLLPRYDAIVACIDSNISVRGSDIYIKKGEISSTPVKPEMIRDNDKQEYCLAYIYIGKGVSAITQSNIIDTRADNSICGWVAGLIKELDLHEAFLQYQTASEEDRGNNQSAFDEWFGDVKENLAKSTLIRSYSSTYTTIEQDESVIPIEISQYNQNLDILQVYINGLKLIPNEEYTIDSNEQITLMLPVNIGTNIQFEIFKSIDGSEAETLVSLVSTLQNKVNELENRLSELENN